MAWYVEESSKCMFGTYNLPDAVLSTTFFFHSDSTKPFVVSTTNSFHTAEEETEAYKAYRPCPRLWSL